MLKVRIAWVERKDYFNSLSLIFGFACGRREGRKSSYLFYCSIIYRKQRRSFAQSHCVIAHRGADGSFARRGKIGRRVSEIILDVDQLVVNLLVMVIEV